MKKSLLSILGLALSVSVIAQPTLDENDLNYNSVGVTYESASAQYINPGPGGANVTWDFSAFSSTGTSTLVTQAANQSFPNSNITLNYGQAETYFEENATGRSMWGIDASGTIITYTDPEKVLFYPLTYNSSEINNFAASFFSGVQFDRAGTTEVTYDGYGTVITPTGTFNNAVRVYTQQVYSDTYSGGVINYVSHIYTWYIANYPDPIASVSQIFVDGQLNNSYSLYTTSQTASLLTEENKDFEVYPNPATDEIKFRSLNNQEVEQIKIINNVGQVVRSISTADMTLNNTNVNVSDLESGVYFVHITGKNGLTQSRKFIKQ